MTSTTLMIAEGHLVKPLCDFETGARVTKPSAVIFDFAYGRAGKVCRDGGMVGVQWDGGNAIYEYPGETEFAPAVLE